MAEPLSIATGVTSLVFTTFKLARSTKDFLDSIAGAPTTIKTIWSDVDALSLVLHELQTLLEEPQTARMLAYSRMVDILPGPLDNFTDCLNRLKNAVAKYVQPSGVARRNWRRVTWTFREKEFADLQQRLGNCKESLMLGISMLTL